MPMIFEELFVTDPYASPTTRTRCGLNFAKVGSIAAFREKYPNQWSPFLKKVNQMTRKARNAVKARLVDSIKKHYVNAFTRARVLKQMKPTGNVAVQTPLIKCATSVLVYVNMTGCTPSTPTPMIKIVLMRPCVCVPVLSASCSWHN